MKSSSRILSIANMNANYTTRYTTHINGKWKVQWRCPIHRRYASLIERCYAPYRLDIFPSYAECYVSKSWLNDYMTFYDWAVDKYEDGYQLDKDILVPGNKCYSAETCCFVSPATNYFFVNIPNKNPNLPNGVVQIRGMYKASYGKLGYSHLVTTPEEAQMLHLEHRIRIADNLKTQNKDVKVIDAIQNYINKSTNIISEIQSTLQYKFS